MAPKKFHISLETQVLIGLVLGLAAGVFFGDMVAFTKIAGDAFIKLLQITVIPYIIVSLITALGRLSYDEVKSLGLKAGGVLLILWGVGLVVVFLAPLSFPNWPSASFFSTSLVETVKPVDFLQLYIPSNPFFALANAIVPAIVVFSMMLGLALIGVKNKDALIEPLDAVAEALMRVTGFVAKLTPYGVFALIAGAAGTLETTELARLQVYIVIYVTLALILSFWFLPALVATVTPLNHGEIIKALRGALITAFATGSLLVVLPLLAEAGKNLIGTTENDDDPAEEETQSSVDVLLPVAYNFPSIGIILSLLFVLFGGWYTGASISISQYPVMAFAGLASLFGGTVLAIKFVLDLMRLPADLFQLFITVNVIGARFGALLAAMQLTTIALIGTYALKDRIRIKLWPVLRFIGISVAIIAAALIGVRAFYTYVIVAPYTKDQMLKGLHLLEKPQPAKVYRKLPRVIPQTPEPGTGLARVRQNGTIRVCYTTEDYPAAFFNQQGALVGFDIEMAYRFAKDLDLQLELLPFDTVKEAMELVNSSRCDIIMALWPIDPSMIDNVIITHPVLTSSAGLIVPDHRRREFRSWEDIHKMENIRVASYDDAGDMRLARRLLPNATIVPISDNEDLRKIMTSGGAGIDAIISLAELGAVWTLLYPQFSLVSPTPVLFIDVGYAVARGEVDLANYFNAWLAGAKNQGIIDAFYRYWMLGQVDKTQPPRWSIIRDVLHWVE
jgi:Na+/H+-dicarboxylate symporter/ABC-type amino acid transport substrate-binding protein